MARDLSGNFYVDWKTEGKTMFVIVARSDGDTWAIGPFNTENYAREIMLGLEEKYETIDYDVAQLLEPRSYVDDLAA